MFSCCCEYVHEGCVFCKCDEDQCWPVLLAHADHKTELSPFVTYHAAAAAQPPGVKSLHSVRRLGRVGQQSCRPWAAVESIMLGWAALLPDLESI